MSDEMNLTRGRSRLRMMVAFGVGVVAAVVTGVFGGAQYAAITGWAAACIVYILWVWIVVWGMDQTRTQEHATLEDPARRLSDFLLLLASVAGVLAVVYILVQARQLHGAAQALVATLAIASVALSWTLVHTLYTLRYARMYYRGSEGGISFNQDARPRYSDFAYLSFTLGMTYQVSDTNISDSDIRRAVLRHTLLSYLFGSVILASTVNLVAGLT